MRLEGYDKLPSALPTPPPGRGPDRPSRRCGARSSRALAAAGLHRGAQLPVRRAASARRVRPGAPTIRAAHALRLANPLSDDRAGAAHVAAARAARHAAAQRRPRQSRPGAVRDRAGVLRRAGTAPAAPRPGVDRRPSDEELAALDAALPDQPRHLGAVLAGDVEPPGWWGPGRAADWADAIEAARVVARGRARRARRARGADARPWHPGRCAELLLDGRVVGHAGELHPRVVAALGLPERTCAMELDLDAFAPPRPAQAPRLSTYPPVLLDVAWSSTRASPAADVLAAVRDGRRRAAGVGAAVRRLRRRRAARRRAAGRWRSRCGSGRPTARSPSRRPPRPATRRSRTPRATTGRGPARH